MRSPFLALDKRISGRLKYPGCSEKELFGHTSVWKSAAFAFFHSLLLTLGFLIFAPQLTILIHYGYTLIILFTITLSLFLIFPRHFMKVGFSQGLTFNLITFYYILKLGGIPTSGGLIFVGITTALATVPLQMAWYSVMMFSIYLVLVVFMVLLKPWLHTPAQMTPALNSVVFMINTMSMSGASLLFVLNFIRQQRKVDEMEAGKLKEINEVRSKLFTNITHEFRTPLTVIQGMAGLIETKPEEWKESGLRKIKDSSTILLRLVNQMLNIARIETGAMPVHLVRGDVTSYLAYLVELFRSAAISRNVDLKFASDRTPFEMDFDADKMMHILSNLVSNALKFTPAGGRVEVSAGTANKGKTFVIKVKDSGIGIPEEHLYHLFDRFYQVENRTGGEGSGLGLALTKEIVELLRGTITVESAPGTGTEFSVVLPVSNTASKVENEQELALRVKLEEHPVPAQSSGEKPAGKTEPVADRPVLLIVEDNDDVVHYLKAFLNHEYHVEVAANGRRALEKAQQEMPDIILSDVMMPEMDGIELLVKVKSDIRTSHIPVVMLTAKADIDSRLEGLERGADAYLAKPFDEKELRIQLRNLVEIRKKLHARYASFDNLTASPDASLKMEDAFMMKVKQVLEANLEDDEFGVNRLCNELGVSHAQLYRKFKSLSNFTIADFFKSLRLHKAKELLMTTDLNVTEVTFAVGFKNLSHFSREFSREFGRTPSEMKVQGSRIKDKG